MQDAEHRFFAEWWNAFREAPTNVSLLLTTGSPDLIAAAAVIAPGAPHLGPVSGTKLGKWLIKRSSDGIYLDEMTPLLLIKHESNHPGTFWRLRPKEEMAVAA